MYFFRNCCPGKAFRLSMGCAREAQDRGLWSSSKFRWSWESCLIAAFVSAPAFCCLFSWLVSLTEHYGKLIFGHQNANEKEDFFFSSLVAEHCSWWKTLASFVFPVPFWNTSLPLVGLFLFILAQKAFTLRKYVILPAVDQTEARGKKEVRLG